MISKDKTKKELIDELDRLRYRLAEIEQVKLEQGGEAKPRLLNQFMIDFAPDAIYCIENSSKIVDVSNSCSQMLGYSREEFLTMTVHDIDSNFPPEDWESHWENLRNRKSFTMETNHKTKDGNLIPVEIIGNYAIVDDKEYSCTFARDITKRKWVEEKLRESEELYRDLYEEAPVAYFSVGVNGRIKKANPCAGDMLGYSIEDLIGRPLFDLYANTETGKVKAQKVFQRFLSGEEIRKEELEMRNIDGSSVWISLTVRSVKDEKGQVISSRSIAVDITKRKRTEQVLQETREYIENIVDTVREPLLVLDADMTVISANRSFYQIFNLMPKKTEGKLLYDLGNRQWDIPKLRELLEGILPKNTSFDNYEVEYDFETIGKRVMLLNARRIYKEANKTQMILLAFEDITERKQAEEELKDRLEELEKWYKVTVGREMMMVELKKEIKELKKQLAELRKKKP